MVLKIILGVTKEIKFVNGKYSDTEFIFYSHALESSYYNEQNISE
jgi:hypothetical protein